MDYSGAIYVKGSEGSDYVGLVFGYQSNRKFYVVMWRKENSNFESSNVNSGIKGVQLKVSCVFRNWKSIGKNQRICFDVSIHRPSVQTLGVGSGNSVREGKGVGDM